MTKERFRITRWSGWPGGYSVIDETGGEIGGPYPTREQAAEHAKDLNRTDGKDAKR